MKKIVCLLLIWMLPLTVLAAQEPEDEGDEKIQETIKRIEEEAAKKEKEKEEDEEGNPFLDLFFRLLDELFLDYFISIRFTSYPYADRDRFYFASTIFVTPGATKVLSLGLVTDLANHLDGTFGNSSRVSLQLSALHANFFHQVIFARTVSLSVSSLNGGLSLVLPKFLLNGYAGFYTLNVIDRGLASFGVSAQLFLPGRLYLDFYNLNAVLNAVQFVHLAVSLNWSFWRFAVGVGYNYNRYIDDTYSGPCLRISFWL